jgi:hypothetical protein
MWGTFCDNRVPPHARTQVKLFFIIKQNDVIIIESRPHFKNPEQWTEMPIAKLSYDKDSLEWSLFWSGAEGDWNSYPEFIPTKDLMIIINELEEDPDHLFWG